MSQNSLALPTSNLPGLTLIQMVNAANGSLATLFSGAAAPTASGLGLSGLAGLLWHDLATDTLKIRDQADESWITIGGFDEDAKTFTAAGSSSSSASIDYQARDQLALTNLRLELVSSVSTGALVAGKQWELTTDEWGSASSGQQYTSGSPAYYTSYSGTTTINASATNWGGGTSTYTFGATGQIQCTSSTGNAVYFQNAVLSGDFDLSFTLHDDSQTGAFNTTWGNLHQFGLTAAVNSGSTTAYNASLATAYYLGYDTLGSGKSVSLYTAKTVLGTATGLTLAAGDVMTISRRGSTLTVKQNGTVVLTYAGFATTAAYPFVGCGGQATAPVTFDAVTWRVDISAANMTLIPPPFGQVSAAPSAADLYFLWKDDSGSATPGTDLTVDLSRDGGTTWVAAALTNLLGTGGFDGTYAVIKARADLSAAASGTSLSARIKTLNLKAQRVAAPALYAE